MNKMTLAVLSSLLICASPHLKAETTNEDFLYGHELIQQKDYEKAIEVLTESLKSHPSNAFSWERRGYANYCLGNYYDAIDNYTMAILLSPVNAVFYLQRALAYHASGNINAMKNDFINAAKRGNPSAQEFLTKNNISWQ